MLNANQIKSKPIPERATVPEDLPLDAAERKAESGELSPDKQMFVRKMTEHLRRAGH